MELLHVHEGVGLVWFRLGSFGHSKKLLHFTDGEDILDQLTKCWLWPLRKDSAV